MFSFFLVVDINTAIEECTRPAWLDLAFWAISGGLISGTFQLISEKMGNKNLRLSYKKILDDNKDLRKRLDILFNRKEMYKDTVDIIESKIEMYNRIVYPNSKTKEYEVTQCNSCVHLIDEILAVINKTKPHPETGKEADKTFGIEDKNN